MKGLPNVVLAPSRNIAVAPTTAAPDFGMGDGKVTAGAPIAPADLNSHPEAVTPNATVKPPVTMDFGSGDLANGPDEDNPDAGHLLNTKK